MAITEADIQRGPGVEISAVRVEGKVITSLDRVRSGAVVSRDSRRPGMFVEPVAPGAVYRVQPGAVVDLSGVMIEVALENYEAFVQLDAAWQRALESGDWWKEQMATADGQARVQRARQRISGNIQNIEAACMRAQDQAMRQKPKQFKRTKHGDGKRRYLMTRARG